MAKYAKGEMQHISDEHSEKVIFGSSRKEDLQPYRLQVGEKLLQQDVDLSAAEANEHAYDPHRGPAKLEGMLVYGVHCMVQRHGQYPW